MGPDISAVRSGFEQGLPLSQTSGRAQRTWADTAASAVVRAGVDVLYGATGEVLFYGRGNCTAAADYADKRGSSLREIWLISVYQRESAAELVLISRFVLRNFA